MTLPVDLLIIISKYLKLSKSLKICNLSKNIHNDFCAYSVEIICKNIKNIMGLKQNKYKRLKKLSIGFDYYGIHYLSEFRFRADDINLSHLQNLTELEFDAHAVGDLIASINPIEKLTKIKKLTLRNSGDMNLNNFLDLEHLTLKFCEISDKNILKLCKVKNLVLDYCQNISTINHMVNVEYLHISYNRFITSDSVMNLKKLKFLIMNYNGNVTDINALSNLEVLSCGKKMLNEGIKDLKNITNLMLNNSKITNISHLKKLTHLGANEFIDETTLEQLPNLRTLDLSYKNKIRDLRNFKNIKKITTNKYGEPLINELRVKCRKPHVLGYDIEFW